MGFLTAEDGLSVLGFMFELGDGENEPLRNITDGIDLLMSSTTPSGPYARESDPKAVPIELNLSYFVDQDNSQGFHTYPGSLTTPGCNEVVTWINFRRPIIMSFSQ